LAGFFRGINRCRFYSDQAVYRSMEQQTVRKTVKDKLKPTPQQEGGT
jgi:hypothetical protein